MNKIEVRQRIKVIELLVIVAATGVLIFANWSKVIAQQTDFSDEKIVHLLDEPRHRTVHNEGNMYLLDVQVNPGDISFAHVHDQPILLTTIRTGAGPTEAPVRSIPEYYSEPLTHKVSNDGPGLLRIIAFVNGGDGVEGFGDSPTGMSKDADLLNPWFRSHQIELGAGEQTNLQTHNNHTVIVQRSEGVVHITREDGLTHELNAAGEWEWRNPGSTFLIRNMGNTSVIVAINEARE